MLVHTGTRKTRGNMRSSDEKQAFRSIPSVDEILGAPEIAALREAHPLFPWTRLARAVTSDVRAGRYGGLPASREEARSMIVRAILSREAELRTGGSKRVINGTGVVLNTNLGRAVLPREAVDAVRDAMTHYVSLEIDLDSGKRSHRGDLLEDLIALATDAERAMVVNNNAAAVWLVVSSFSPPGRVVVSRGELVEIGGSFRLPDILAGAASDVIEIGTTNRTYAADYAAAARPGDVFLKVHRSNYDIQGFTHEAGVSELVGVAAEKKCFVVFDLGSGCLFDFASRGLAGETRVQDAVRTGVDCVTMSGDKLLGGVQAGIIAGKEAFVKKLGENPLRRALRIDKTTIAALQALLRVYLFGASPETNVPILRQSVEGTEGLKSRADRIIAGISPSMRAAFDVRSVEDTAAIGGGSFACQDLPSVAVAVRCESESGAVALSRKMRRANIPILSRIKGNEVRINLRSVLPYEDDEVASGLNAVLETP
jgi:L-seryl-tRNA(Ser) seleniumtransferase